MNRTPISQGPHNYLGTDTRGRPHWRATPQAKQARTIAAPGAPGQAQPGAPPSASLPAWKVKDRTRPRPEPIGVGEGATFFSPNVEENLTWDQALDRVVSPNHARYRKFAEHVAKDLGLRAETYDSVGYWKTGAEDSVMVLYGGGNFRDRLYHAAMLAKVGYQLCLGIFQEHPHGSDAAHILDTEIDDPDVIKEHLDASGIENFTLTRTEWGYRLAVLDGDMQLQNNVLKLGKALNADVHTTRGVVAFIGAGTRDDAQKLFDRIIEHYEARGRGYGEPVPAVGTFDGRNPPPGVPEEAVQPGAPERPRSLVGDRPRGDTPGGGAVEGTPRVASPEEAGRLIERSAYKKPLFAATVALPHALENGAFTPYFTTSPQVAAEIAESVKDVIKIARGEMDLEAVEKWIVAQGGDPLAAWKNTEHMGDFDPEKRERMKGGMWPHPEKGSPPQGAKGWLPHGPKGQDGSYQAHFRPQTPGEQRRIALELYQNGRATIAAAGGRLDPFEGHQAITMGLEVERLAQMDPAQVGVYEARALVQSADEVQSSGESAALQEVTVDPKKVVVIAGPSKSSASTPKKKVA